jgi:uncharacterized protein
MAELIKPVDVAMPFQMAEAGYPVTSQGRDTLDALIQDCLLTTPGERPYRPTYGSWLRRILFSNIGNPSLLQARSEIVRAVGAWVPQVTIVSVDFVVDDTAVQAFVSWQPSGSGGIATTTLEFRQ